MFRIEGRLAVALAVFGRRRRRVAAKGEMEMRRSLACVVLVFVAADPLYSQESLYTARPIATGVALVNPGMGWMLHYYDNSLRN